MPTREGDDDSSGDRGAGFEDCGTFSIVVMLTNVYLAKRSRKGCESLSICQKLPQGRSLQPNFLILLPHQELLLAVVTLPLCNFPSATPADRREICAGVTAEREGGERL